MTFPIPSAMFLLQVYYHITPSFLLFLLKNDLLVEFFIFLIFFSFGSFDSSPPEVTVQRLVSCWTFSHAAVGLQHLFYPAFFSICYYLSFFYTFSRTFSKSWGSYSSAQSSLGHQEIFPAYSLIVLLLWSGCHATSPRPKADFVGTERSLMWTWV
jgi:hypothetical protein